MASYGERLRDFDGHLVPDPWSIPREEAVEVLLEDKRKHCEKAVLEALKKDCKADIKAIIRQFLGDSK